MKIPESRINILNECFHTVQLEAIFMEAMLRKLQMQVSILYYFHSAITTKQNWTRKGAR